jgi:hypothetical protein
MESLETAVAFFLVVVLMFLFVVAETSGVQQAFAQFSPPLLVASNGGIPAHAAVLPSPAL